MRSNFATQRLHRSAPAAFNGNDEQWTKKIQSFNNQETLWPSGMWCMVDIQNCGSSWNSPLNDDFDLNEENGTRRRKSNFQKAFDITGIIHLIAPGASARKDPWRTRSTKPSRIYLNVLKVQRVWESPDSVVTSWSDRKDINLMPSRALNIFLIVSNTYEENPIIHSAITLSKTENDLLLLTNSGLEDLAVSRTTFWLGRRKKIKHALYGAPTMYLI